MRCRKSYRSPPASLAVNVSADRSGVGSPPTAPPLLLQLITRCLLTPRLRARSSRR